MRWAKTLFFYKHIIGLYILFSLQLLRSRPHVLAANRSDAGGRRSGWGQRASVTRGCESLKAVDDRRLLPDEELDWHGTKHVRRLCSRWGPRIGRTLVGSDHGTISFRRSLAFCVCECAIRTLELKQQVFCYHDNPVTMRSGSVSVRTVRWNWIVGILFYSWQPCYEALLSP